MGSSSSKLAKPLPRLSGKPIKSTILPSARSEKPAPPRFSETKNEAIQSNAQDPNYMQNLNSIGVVWVPPKPMLRRSNNNMIDILKKRAASESAADVPTPNRISAQTLSNLLDDRKSAKTIADVDNIIKEYGVDMDTRLLESLALHLTSPSVSHFKSLKDDTLDTQEAKWADPPMIKSKQATINASS